MLEDCSCVGFFCLLHLQLAACVVYIYVLGLTFYPIACSASADTYFDGVVPPFITEQNLQKNVEWFVVHRLIICSSEDFWRKRNGTSFIAVNNKKPVVLTAANVWRGLLLQGMILKYTLFTWGCCQQRFFHHRLIFSCSYLVHVSSSDFYRSMAITSWENTLQNKIESNISRLVEAVNSQQDLKLSISAACCYEFQKYNIQGITQEYFKEKWLCQ